MEEGRTTSNQKAQLKRRLQHIEDVEKERTEIFKNDTDSEIWKDIPNFDGKYQASNLGRIRCMPTTYITSNGWFRRSYYYFPKHKVAEGYLQMPLTDSSGKIHHKGTHRWIMYTFHGESELQVDHINGVRDDNRLENLRYATARENNNYKKDHSPESFSSALKGVYKNGKSWYASICIEGIYYHLGCHKYEVDAHFQYKKALDNWDVSKQLPEKWINPNKTSTHKGVDFHNASGKWRVRVMNDAVYVGIFDTEDIAERVLNICEHLMSRSVVMGKPLIKKIRVKYGKDKRLRHLINTVTGEEFHCLETASKSIGVSPSTLYNKLNKNLINDCPIKYK